MSYQRKDHLYNKAKSEGYRCRAAYKLKELDNKYKLLKPNINILDLGCAPGGWLQVVLEKCSNSTSVIGVDLEEIVPFKLGPKVKKLPIFLKGDITSAKIQAAILANCPQGIDLLLSDMSPKLSGIAIRDMVRSVELVEMAYNVGLQLLKPGGNFIAKIFPSQDAEELAKKIKPSFKNFARQNLDSSRKTSNEFYFVARDFKGN